MIELSTSVCLFLLNKTKLISCLHCMFITGCQGALLFTVTQGLGRSEKSCQPRILHPKKISFNTFCNHQGTEKRGELLSWNHPHLTNESLVGLLGEKPEEVWGFPAPTMTAAQRASTCSDRSHSPELPVWVLTGIYGFWRHLSQVRKCLRLGLPAGISLSQF